MLPIFLASFALMLTLACHSGEKAPPTPPQTATEVSEQEARDNRRKSHAASEGGVAPQPGASHETEGQSHNSEGYPAEGGIDGDTPTENDSEGIGDEDSGAGDVGEIGDGEIGDGDIGDIGDIGDGNIGN